MPEPVRLFISYRSLDFAAVDAIVTRLKSLTHADHTPVYHVWQDKRDIPAGHDWWQSIVEAISACHVFLFMVSQESVRSPICQEELRYARRRNRPVIPIALSGHYYLNPTTAKNDLTFWSEVSAEVTAHNTQLLFYHEETFLSELERSISKFRSEPEQWVDLPAPAPLDPRNSQSTGHMLYSEACEFAFLLDFESAETKFRALLGDDRLGGHAKVWVEIIRNYQELRQFPANKFMQSLFVQEWAAYQKRFPTYPLGETVFDPEGLRAKLPATGGDKGAPAKTASANPLLDPRPSPSSGSSWKPSLAVRAQLALKGWALLAVLTGHTRAVASLAWSPDGTRLASASSDCTVRVWDAITFAPIATLTGHRAEIWSTSWSPDGTRLASASADKTLRIWNMQTYQPLQVLQEHSDQVWDVQWSPDGTQFASASMDNTLRIWDASTYTMLARLSTSARWMRLFWAPDGTRLAGQLGDLSVVSLWDAATYQSMGNLKDHQGHVLAILWSPERIRLITSSQEGQPSTTLVRVWDGPSYHTLHTLPTYTRSVTLSPDGKRIAFQSSDYHIQLLGDSRAVLKGHTGQIDTITWSLDGARLASGSWDNTVRVWAVR
ncbi:MAG: TIR domain-containing protein [Chloroflexi bacterium]|nr:TIR domain-containing protein [Chloroflexota bacterium]